MKPQVRWPLGSSVKENPPGGAPRRRASAEPGRGAADAAPSSDLPGAWLPTPPAPRRDVPTTAREPWRAAPSSPPVAAGPLPSSPPPAWVADLTLHLARLRQRFRDVAVVIESVGALRSLRAEEALIEMALFAQSHEHTLELAWSALADCEQLARQLTGRSLSSPPESPAISFAPPSAERGQTLPPTSSLPLELVEDEEGPVTQVDVAPIRVLVVDDDPTVLRAFRRVLSSDHEVLTARDGTEALGIVLAGERVDAIICDIGMPKLDGPAFFSELFELRPQMMPRVVFCTGGQPNEKTQRFLDRLQAPLLFKPVAAADLRQAIEFVRSR